MVGEGFPLPSCKSCNFFTIKNYNPLERVVGDADPYDSYSSSERAGQPRPYDTNTSSLFTFTYYLAAGGRGDPSPTIVTAFLNGRGDPSPTIVTTLLNGSSGTPTPTIVTTLLNGQGNPAPTVLTASREIFTFR